MKGLLVPALCFPLLAFSQKLENLKAVAQGEKIIISYDVSGGHQGDKFDISLYASYNNFISPVQRVSGDVGRSQAPGKDKRIEWDAKNEIGNYKGELSFEVRAEVIGVFALTNSISAAKRGKSVPLAWRGGVKDQNVKIELLHAGISQGAVGTADNNGSYQWTVPSKQKTGVDYQLRLVNGKEVITTGPFVIKPKFPMLVKVIPIVAVVAVVGLAGGSKSSPGSPTKGNVLATPPDLGLN